MSTIANELLNELRDDMISHGWLVQAILLADEGKCPSKARIINVLSELLTTGNVEIGQTHQAKPDYLEFVAWNGGIDERISRAMEAVDVLESRDRDFAYWLCLRENVDRFEGEVR